MNVIKADPAVANVNAYTGGNGASNGGFIYIALKPLNVRKVTAPEIINRLRPKLNRLPVAQSFLQAAQDLRIGGRGSAALYQYTIQSDNVQDLSHWGPILLAQMKKLPGFQDVNTDAQNSGLQELITYDRTTAARLGITPASLGQFSLRRIRAVGSVYHLHTTEPVLRGARGSASLLAEPRWVKEYLSQYHGQRRHSPLIGQLGPTEHHAAGPQSHQLLSIGHRVVQPGARYVVE